jgi:cytochrome oxidase Cu insertion factor (SCO1/SenC/PrrC family)
MSYRTQAAVFAGLCAMLLAYAPIAATAHSAADHLPTISPFRTAVRLKLGDVAPSTQFLDQSGRPFTFAQWRGDYVVLAFIYTRCRDARECPLTSARFAQLQDMLGKNTRLAEITIDPVYDRPPVLAAYGRTYNFRPDRVKLLTGDPNAVLDFAAMLGVTAFEDPQLGFIHNENTVILDPQGHVDEMISENSWTTDEIVAVIAHYEKRPANPIARLDLALSEAAVAVCGNGVAGFSGLLDLGVFLLILIAGGWLIVRVARVIARGGM